MVCIYCEGPTRVSNSRPQKRLQQVWRRRQCGRCGAVFTTNEATDLSGSWVVRSAQGRPEPFSRDTLLVSVLRAVGHREQPVPDAGALTATIISKLLRATRSAEISPTQIASTTLETLQRFDDVAAVQYRAYHKQP